jgi:hypothetical protein
MTIVDRETRCFLAIEAVVYRSQETAQQMVNQAPAQQYYSDQFPALRQPELSSRLPSVAG